VKRYAAPGNPERTEVKISESCPGLKPAPGSLLQPPMQKPLALAL